jgi:hypothetical protein
MRPMRLDGAALQRLAAVKKEEQFVQAQSTTEEVQNDAREALKAVGWAMPAEGDLTSEDPFVKAINQGIQKDIGVSLDELLNPAKVVNLERDLYVFRTELAQLTGATLPADVAALDLTTAACDGGGGGEAADELRTKIAKKETDLAMERRSVFRGWLKNIFLGQAILRYAFFGDVIISFIVLVLRRGRGSLTVVASPDPYDALTTAVVIIVHAASFYRTSWPQIRAPFSAALIGTIRTIWTFPFPSWGIGGGGSLSCHRCAVAARLGRKRRPSILPFWGRRPSASWHPC